MKIKLFNKFKNVSKVLNKYFYLFNYPFFIYI